MGERLHEHFKTAITSVINALKLRSLISLSCIAKIFNLDKCALRKHSDKICCKASCTYLNIFNLCFSLSHTYVHILYIYVYVDVFPACNLSVLRHIYTACSVVFQCHCHGSQLIGLGNRVEKRD